MKNTLFLKGALKWEKQYGLEENLKLKKKDMRKFKKN